MAAKTNALTPLAKTITCHAWNGDRTKIAFCPNNNEIHIYKVVKLEDPSTWEPEQILKEHDQVVSCIDWAPNTNRILTCSHDRNAYVWNVESDGETWKPTLVLLRINRAATCCKWSPDEDKFAVGSGTKTVCICYFEQVNNWWVSKMLKKHKSTIVDVAWHPQNNTILATASTDFRCRVFCAWIKGVDADDKKGAFGSVLAEFTVPGAGGWVHSVAWSPSAATLAFVAHDSSISFSENLEEPQRVASNLLPFTRVAFLSETACVAVGHNCTPVLFVKGGSGWECKGEVDKGQAATKAGQGAGVRGAFDKFQAKDKMGKDEKDNTLLTKHQGVINSIQIVASSGDKVSKFATSGLDGRIIHWDTAAIAKDMGVSL